MFKIFNPKLFSNMFPRNIKFKNFSQSKTDIINPTNSSSDNNKKIFPKETTNDQQDKNQELNLNKFYEFMEENIKSTEIKTNPNQTSSSTDQTIQDDISKLLSVIKCPITESNLEQCDEGLKISHIIYPKRNGIYILTEEEAQFKF